MLDKNNNIVKKFHHLVYYPNLTIEQTVYKIFLELKLDKEVAINLFISRLNFLSFYYWTKSIFCWF